MTAATRSGSTLLAGSTRAREPKRVWNGRLDTALQQDYARGHDRLLRWSQYKTTLTGRRHAVITQWIDAQTLIVAALAQTVTAEQQ